MIGLAKAVYGGCNEYFKTRDGLYDLGELALSVIPVLPSSESLDSLKGLISSHQDISDCLYAAADTTDAVRDLGSYIGSIQSFGDIKNINVVKTATTVCVIVLDGLMLAAVSVEAGFINLTELASRVGMVALPLMPAIRITYIGVLTFSSIDAAYDWYNYSQEDRVREEAEKIKIIQRGNWIRMNRPPEEFENWKALSKDQKWERLEAEGVAPANEAGRRLCKTKVREAQWKIARNVSKIGLQTLCLVASVSIPTMFAVSVGVAAISFSAKVVQTDSMRSWFDSLYDSSEAIFY